MSHYKFFWNGVFSNWYQSNFVVRDVEYTCVEQYMMYQKAKLFNDTNTAIKILMERRPFVQKMLGRNVKNFDASIWDAKKYDIVKIGVKSKFSQNDYLRGQLIKWHGYEFVEASHEDKIWGIGFSENDALKNIENWGQNLLGRILTEVCNELK